MKRGAVTIPTSELGAQIERAAELKRAATELLRQLEERATHSASSGPSAGDKITRPGGWRQDPRSWWRCHTGK